MLQRTTASCHKRSGRLPTVNDGNTLHERRIIVSSADPRKIELGRLCALLNSHPTLGEVVSVARLRRFREQAGYQISQDGITIDFLKFCAWLIVRRHAAKEKASSTAAGDKTKRRLGPRF